MDTQNITTTTTETQSLTAEQITEARRVRDSVRAAPDGMRTAALSALTTAQLVHLSPEARVLDVGVAMENSLYPGAGSAGYRIAAIIAGIVHSRATAAEAARVMEARAADGRCQCHTVSWRTHGQCGLTGPAAQAVMVEWLPHWHTSEPALAPSYPENGAYRLRVSAECAARLARTHGARVIAEQASRLSPSPPIEQPAASAE